MCRREGLPADVCLKTIFSGKVDVVDLPDVRPEVVRSRPLLILRRAGSVVTAVSRPGLMVLTLLMPIAVVGGTKRPRTTWFGAYVRLLVSVHVLSNEGQAVSSGPVN